MKKIYVLLPFLILLSSIFNESNAQSTAKDHILINQIGYPVDAPKKALVRIDGEEFILKNTAGSIVFNAPLGDRKYWELSGDEVVVADFSSITVPGEYTLCVNERCSYPFEIGKNLYDEIADAALKSYYYARAGVNIEPKYGGKWSYEAGHPDTKVFIHASAADANRPKGSVISSPGGWYDAGDYGKYIVNSSITTWTILQSLRTFEQYHTEQNLNIPESDNAFPDILDEALVNLTWMITMQDPNDGGLYHKLTTKNFDDFIMPAATTKPRFVVMKTTSATLDFASTMAMASRTLESYGLSDLAGTMEKAASDAWNWAIATPDVFYVQPDDISTGAYVDTSFVDEWFWASAEMYLLTGETQFKEKMMEFYQEPITPKWDVVNALGVISLLTSDRRSEFAEIEEDFIAYADLMLEKEKTSPYHISMDQFAWGSNSDVANDGMLKLIAFKLTGNEKYVTSAQNDLDYLLGRNATGFSFVTGFGDKTPLDQHNRIMGADGIEEPIPGYISGGPNTIVLTDCEAQRVIRSTFPAASFTDTQCSYSTNETAINWNAPFVFLSTGLEVYYQE